MTKNIYIPFAPQSPRRSLSRSSFLDAQATAQFYAACIKSAVVFLHDEGYIHRNVTPHCVYITDAGYCQLADLSCAKKMDGNKVSKTE